MAEKTELDQQHTEETEVEVLAGEEHSTAAANGAQPVEHDDGALNEGGEGSDDEPLIQFGDEAPPASEDQEHQDAPQWVKDLRRDNREMARKLRTFEAQQTQQPAAAPAIPTLGPRPKLEEFDYDEGKFDEALGKWIADKAKVDAAQADLKQQQETRERANAEKRGAYESEAVQLRARDFREVESDVVAALSPVQQGILLSGAEKPTTLVYALGRYPNKLRTLAQITDPVKFAFAAGKLEKELKVTPRKSKPAPEARVASSTGASNVDSGSKKLEQLRDEAAKTGDLSKVIAYKRQMKEASRR